MSIVGLAGAPRLIKCVWPTCDRWLETGLRLSLDSDGRPTYWDKNRWKHRHEDPSQRKGRNGPYPANAWSPERGSYREKASLKYIDVASHRRARQFCRSHPGTSYEDVLKLVQNPYRRCWFCGEAGATHIDHDHNTGEIRGWSHPPCNMVEGLFALCPNPSRLVQTLAALFPPPAPTAGA